MLLKLMNVGFNERLKSVIGFKLVVVPLHLASQLLLYYTTVLADDLSQYYWNDRQAHVPEAVNESIKSVLLNNRSFHWKTQPMAAIHLIHNTMSNLLSSARDVLQHAFAIPLLPSVRWESLLTSFSLSNANAKGQTVIGIVLWAKGKQRSFWCMTSQWPMMKRCPLVLIQSDLHLPFAYNTTAVT